MILENIFKNNKQHMNDYRMAILKTRIFVAAGTVRYFTIIYGTCMYA